MTRTVFLKGIGHDDNALSCPEQGSPDTENSTGRNDEGIGTTSVKGPERADVDGVPDTAAVHEDPFRFHLLFERMSCSHHERDLRAQGVDDRAREKTDNREAGVEG